MKNPRKLNISTARPDQGDTGARTKNRSLEDNQNSLETKRGTNGSKKEIKGGGKKNEVTVDKAEKICETLVSCDQKTSKGKAREEENCYSFYVIDI